MQDELVKLTKELITFQTTKDKPEEIRACLDFCAKKLADFNVIELRGKEFPSLLITNTASKDLEQHFRFLMNGHIDVVSANRKQFVPLYKNGRIYGRGAVDMKGSVAAMMLAFQKVAGVLDFPVGLQIVSDEEIGGFDGTYGQLESGVRTDFALIGEATNLAVEVSAKGTIYITLTARGKSAHGAYPWRGVSAIDRMVVTLNKIRKLFPQSTKETWGTTLNIGTIHAGASHNQVSDECTASLDIRRSHSEPADKVLDKVRSALVDGVELKVNYNEPAVKIQRENKDLQLLKESIEEVIGEDSRELRAHGASDARHFQDFAIPVVCFGPGGEGLHSEKEWVDASSLETEAEILIRFLKSLDQ